MDHPSYWKKQGTDKPLYPNLLWSRPETRLGAGKLLIIGGQAHEFKRVATAYEHAEKAGAGTIRVVMPDSTRKATSMLPNIEYAPANQSGSFSKEAFGELLDASLWADGILLAGDLGNNSETSLMLNNFLRKTDGLLCVASEDALKSISLDAAELFNRNNLFLCISHSSLRQYCIDLSITTPVTSDISQVSLASVLNEISADHSAGLIVTGEYDTWTAHNGQITSTRLSSKADIDALTSACAVWLMQNKSKVTEALATAVFMSRR